MTGVAIGMKLVRHRLASVSSVLGVVFAIGAVFVVALLLRRTGSNLAADRALSGIALGLALPLLAHGTVARALGGAHFEAALAEPARHGGNRREIALGVGLALSLVLAMSGALVAAVAVLVVRAPADPALVRDLVTSSWIGALAGASYAAWFCLASTVGRSGGGRMVALFVDFVAGASAGLSAMFWPRGHVRNLLGGEPVWAMPQWSATLALLLLAGGYLALGVWRVRR
ncbi:MAG: hypothetical protein L6Q84_00340 [Polyangiaceae bacterium]|nr:hypothetical protein [Polyangiaceae bacterium]